MPAYDDKINFPAVDMRTKVENGETYVFDIVRGGWLVLTPEERVRRHAIGFLMSHCGAELRSVATEYPVGLNGTSQRADIVVFDGECRPAALVECKATDVRIGPDVLAQAVRYNSVLGARYIILTNGIRHFCYERTASGYRPMSRFPDLRIVR
ncbi:MAG: type I restriction enzyme HsdR N-terminal domain-containing protein [Alistipes sp.]|nr:type I restriction enzyme HsdR N-terminal domain-containing protein [Alistipes sp.]